MESDKIMNTRSDIRQYSIALTANTPYALSKPGNLLHIYNATSPITFQTDDGANITLVTGMSCERDYDTISLLSNVNQSVIVTLGYGKINDNRATVNAQITADTKIANTFTTSADVSIAGTTQVQVLAAVATRKTAIISSLSTNTANLRVGDAGSAIGEGIELTPGGTVTLDTTDAIKVYNPDAAVQVVTIGELKYV